MNKKITNQDLILRQLYLRHKEATVEDLVRFTRLKPNQIRRAVQRLKQRDLIIKKREFSSAGYRKPPVCSIKIKLKHFHFIRRYLFEKGEI